MTAKKMATKTEDELIPWVEFKIEENMNAEDLPWVYVPDPEHTIEMISRGSTLSARIGNKRCA